MLNLAIKIGQKLNYYLLYNFIFSFYDSNDYLNKQQ